MSAISNSLSVLFKDETLVDISQHSMLLIDDFVYDPTTSTGALAIKATLGTLRYVSGEIANNAAENINISTLRFFLIGYWPPIYFCLY